MPPGVWEVGDSPLAIVWVAKFTAYLNGIAKESFPSCAATMPCCMTPGILHTAKS